MSCSLLALPSDATLRRTASAAHTASVEGISASSFIDPQAIALPSAVAYQWLDSCSLLFLTHAVCLGYVRATRLLLSRHNPRKTIGVFAHLGAPPWQFPWQTIAALAARRTQPVGAMGPWQSSGASTVTPSLRRVRAGALCDMLFKVQQPKRPGKDSRVGLEVSTRS